MWNIIFVLIIAAVIWMFAPSLNITPSPKNSTNVKQSDVNNVVNEAVNQANQARELQKKEQEDMSN